MAFGPWKEGVVGPQSSTSRSGNKRALCIGIDRYPAPAKQLHACVNDAKAWKQLFESQGFSATILPENQATYTNILNAIGQIVTSARSGDVIAIHYSGHGTQLQRSSGDEPTDEALVPLDYNNGRFIVDDDLGAINDQIQDGVSVTYFMDCCHSGSNTRTLFGVDLQDLHPGELVRYMPVSAALQARYFRNSRNRSFVRASPYERRREVLFSACEPLQLSIESGGQGHFTRRAIEAFRQGTSGLSNERYIARVRQLFGDTSRQRPGLWSDDSLYTAQVLGQRSSGSSGGHFPSGGGQSPGAAGGATEQLQSILDQLNDLSF